MRCFNQVICALAVAVVLVPTLSFAQAKTDAEVRQEQEVRAQQGLRDEQARTQATHDQAASDLAKAQSDAAEMARLKATAPEREAAAREREAQERAQSQALSDQIDAINARAFLTMEGKVKLEELQKLRDNPPPVAAPGSYTECDRMAAAPMTICGR